jgi:hypothetical protein
MGKSVRQGLQRPPSFAKTSAVIELAVLYDIKIINILRRNGRVPRENREFSMDERAAEARAQSGAAWRVLS